MFAKIWCHETLRVLFDRLVNDEDREKAFKKLSSCVKMHFKDPMEELFEDLVGEGKMNHEKMNGLLFGGKIEYYRKYYGV
jgi:dynein heavy chain